MTFINEDFLLNDGFLLINESLPNFSSFSSESSVDTEPGFIYC